MAEGISPIIYLVYSKWAHFGAHSGYDLLSQHVGAPLPVSSRLLRLSGVSLMAKIYARLRGYDSSQFHKQLTVGLKMLWGQRAIYHLLYGDFEKKYLRQFPGSRKHKIIATFHMPPEILEKKRATCEGAKALDGVVAIGRNQVDLLSDFVGPERVFFVPRGVDTKFFVPGEQGEQHEAPTVLCVGNTFRDFSTLYEVVVRVGKRIPQVRFLLVANPVGIEPQLAKLSSLPNFDFRSGINEAELLKAYQESQVLFLPLLDSTSNNALLEGMSCGLPVVVTDVGGVRDYVNADSVALVPPRDSEVATEALIDLLYDERKRERWAAANRQHALRLDWAIVAEQMKQVYQQVWRN